MPRTKKDAETVSVEEALAKMESEEETVQETGSEENGPETAREAREAPYGTEEETDPVPEAVIDKTEMPIEESGITPEKVAGFEVTMELADAFIRRTVNVPGSNRRMRKAAREAFGENEEIIGDDNEELMTYGKAKKLEYEILSDSANSLKPKVLYGVVDGIEDVNLGSVRTIMAVCHLVATNAADINTEKEIRSAIYKIRIPAPLFFIDENGKYESPDAYDNLRYSMSMRIGSIIEFVVYNISLEDEDVLASRIGAMQIRSYDNYLGKRARIKPGSLAKGRIVHVSRSGIVVDVMGADVFIRRDELTWRYLDDLVYEKEFKLGKAILVRVTSVDTGKTNIYGREYPYVKIKASAKDAKENPNKMYFKRYEVGQKYVGYIAYHLKTGEYIVNLGQKNTGINSEQATCICKAPAMELGGVPHNGQKCVIAIIAKDPATFRIMGAFTHMEP